MYRASYTTSRTACQLLKQLWDHQSDGTHRFICTKDVDGKWHEMCLTDWSEPVLRQIIERNHQSDLYFCPHGFDGPKRSAARSVPPRMLYADLDEVDPRGVKPLPTIAWESSPGRYQAIWLLTSAITSWEVNQRLTYAIGADKGGWDPTQVLRIPGTANYKYDAHPVGRVLWNAGDVYSLDDFSGLPEVGKAEVIDIPTGDLGQLAQRAWKRIKGNLLPLVVEWISSAKPPKESEDRSEPQWFIETSLKEAGASREECYAIVKVQLRWNKFDDDRLWDEIGRVYAGSADEMDEELSKLVATPFKFDAQPPREWIYGHDYARGLLSMTSARGGAGKTRLVLVEAAAIITHRNLVGVAPKAQCNVWYIGEDPMADLQRYIEALMTHHEIPRQLLEKGLFVNSMRDGTRPIFTTQTRDGVKIRTPIVDTFCDQIRKNNIGVWICDPVIKTYAGIKEIDNNAMAEVMNTYTNIAIRTNSAGMLLHHIRKGNGQQTEITLDDIRGAGGIADETRIARMLQKSTKDDKLWGDDDPRDYFRVDDAKYTHAKPVDARWYHMLGVTLANGKDDVSTCEQAFPITAEVNDGVLSFNSDRAVDVLARHGPMNASEWARMAGVHRKSIMRLCARNHKVTKGPDGLWRVTTH